MLPALSGAIIIFGGNLYLCLQYGNSVVLQLPGEFNLCVDIRRAFADAGFITPLMCLKIPCNNCPQHSIDLHKSENLTGSPFKNETFQVLN